MLLIWKEYFMYAILLFSSPRRAIIARHSRPGLHHYLVYFQISSFKWSVKIVLIIQFLSMCQPELIIK